jgi:hypothetical protein
MLVAQRALDHLRPIQPGRFGVRVRVGLGKHGRVHRHRDLLFRHTVILPMVRLIGLPLSDIDAR